MENFTPQSLAERLQALPAAVVYAQLTGCDHWGEQMERCVPEHMRAGLIRWIAFGRTDQLGHFMRALLEGDLYGTYNRADEVNMANIENWIRFLYNYAPSGCFSSPEKVAAWSGLCQEEGS